MGNNNSNTDKKGLRVTKVSPNSPATNTDLMAYTDFITAVVDAGEGFNLENDFYKYVIENENKKIVLNVYNILTKKNRLIGIVASRDWPNADFLLGFKVRYESIHAAELNIYRISRVIDVNLKKEIHPLFDFLIAVNEFTFKDIGDLKEKLSLYQKCELVIFNLEDTEVRKVPINYNRKKGIGFEIASGYLHDLSYLYGLKLMENSKRKGLELEMSDLKVGEDVQLNSVTREEDIREVKEKVKETVEDIKEEKAEVSNMEKPKEEVKVESKEEAKEEAKEEEAKIEEAKVESKEEEPKETEKTDN